MQFDVVFESGETIAYRVKPRHLVRYERWIATESKRRKDAGEVELDADSAEASFAMAWVVSDSPEAYESWLARVDEVRGEDEPGVSDEALAVAGSAGGGGEATPS